MAAELQRQLQTVRPGDHLCLIHDGPGPELAAVVPFLRDGLARGERCICVGDEVHVSEVVVALDAAGVDVDHECRRGSLLLFDQHRFYLDGTPFDPSTMVAVLQQMVQEALLAGYMGIRGAAGMSAAIVAEIGVNRLAEYEALLNRALPGSRMTAMCRYDRASFGPEILHLALRTHSFVVIGDMVCPNLYYEPPELFLDDATYSPPSAGPARVDWMLSQLQKVRATSEAIRASEERHRLLFERNLAGVYSSSVDGRLLDCNDSFAAILGYASRTEVVGRPTSDLYFADADRAAFLTALRRTGTLTNYEAVMRRKDGSRVWVLENTSLLSGPADSGVIEGTLVEITQRKQAEESAHLSAARYRSLIENLSQGVYLKDTALRFVVANRPFCAVLGCEESTIVGKTDFDVYPGAVADLYHADDLRVLREGQRFEVERQQLGDGQPRTVRIVRTPVHDERGQVIGVLGICWDVTQQQGLEAQLRQAQKMEAVGLLAGGVAHDFNNLLSVILGNIALALGGVGEDHPNRELLLAAERAGVQAAELTNQLLGFSRQTLLRPVPAHLDGCMEETLRILRRTIDPRISLDVRAAPQLWMVEADPTQMNQVLMNLCLNARDAMPEGGRLLLELDNVLIDDEYARHHVEARPGEFVRLRISDSGHGIPPEIRGRIFEPFFTTKAAGKGTGLGLAMVFGIIKQHQGWIDCVSEVGHGTRFEIFLPRHGIGIAGPTPQPIRQAPSGGTETILLADDEPMIRKLGRTILERYGYAVLLAEDGLEAVQMYQQQMDQIDLVILDLTMPRMSGHDALHQLCQMDPSVRVLFASGYSAEQMTNEHPDQVLGFLSKPYRPETLARAVRDVLDRARAGVVK
ncbi:MAG: MEDS domain-containing protein [Gemmataceae bacterium]|nr:MEDS domain-containing protein [Gemmataceae bacterium]